MTEISIKISRIGLSRKPLSKMTRKELEINMLLITEEIKNRDDECMEGLGALFG